MTSETSGLESSDLCRLLLHLGIQVTPGGYQADDAMAIDLLGRLLGVCGSRSGPSIKQPIDLAVHLQDSPDDAQDLPRSTKAEDVANVLEDSLMAHGIPAREVWSVAIV